MHARLRYTVSHKLTRMTISYPAAGWARGCDPLPYGFGFSHNSRVLVYEADMERGIGVYCAGRMHELATRLWGMARIAHE